MRPANERRCYNVTSSLIGWAHTQNEPCDFYPIDVLMEKSADPTSQSAVRYTARLNPQQRKYQSSTFLGLYYSSVLLMAQFQMKIR